MAAMPAFMRIPALLCLLLAVSACARKVDVLVDALGAPHQEKTYIVLPGGSDMRPDDLYFAEYSGHVASAMRVQGFRMTENIKEADAAVLLSWDVDEESYAVVESSPYYGSAWLGAPVYYGGRGYYRGRRGYPRYSPGYYRPYSAVGLGYAAPSYSVSNRIYYVYRITLDAVSLPDDKNPQSKHAASLWKITMRAKGNSPDMRGAFPVMLSGGAEYIGKDTGGATSITLEKNSETGVYTTVR